MTAISGIFLLALLAALLVMQWMRKRKFNCLPKAPGAWPLIGHLPVMVSFAVSESSLITSLLQWLDRNCDTYRDDGLFYIDAGPLFDFVMVFGAQHMEQILSLPAAQQHQGLLAHYAHDLFAGGGVMVSSGAQNVHERRQLLQFFRLPQMPLLERISIRYASDFCDVIAAHNGRVSDVMRTVNRATLPAVFDMVLGVRGEQYVSIADEFCRDFQHLHELAAKCMLNPLMQWRALYRSAPEIGGTFLGAQK